MKKAAVLSILVAVAVLAVGVIAEAQQPKKVPLIGFLGRPSLAAIKPLADAFRQGLRELGYVEGQSLAIEKVVRCKLATMGPKFSECRDANQVKKNKDFK